jgi:hypothetical protein
MLQWEWTWTDCLDHHCLSLPHSGQSMPVIRKLIYLLTLHEDQPSDQKMIWLIYLRTFSKVYNDAANIPHLPLKS